MSCSRIGVMDSGVGGLTVLRELRHRMPNADLLYLGDTARNPYGSRPTAEICAFSEELAERLIAGGAEQIVVACNTITFTALSELRARSSVPFVGMQIPAVSARRVGVLATPVTISRHAHRERLAAAGATVTEVACEGLAAAIEREDSARIRLLVERYAAAIADCDAAIFGCTHYPLVRSLWERMLPNCRFIDPAAATADRAAQNGSGMGTGRTDIYFTGEHIPALAARLFPTARIGSVDEMKGE